MWWNKKTTTHEDVDKEIELYKRERMLGVEQWINNTDNLWSKMQEFRDFEAGRTARLVELARLDAEIEDKKARKLEFNLTQDEQSRVYAAEINAKNSVISSLEKQIVQLNDLVQFMATKLPAVDLKSLGVTVVNKE